MGSNDSQIPGPVSQGTMGDVGVGYKGSYLCFPDAWLAWSNARNYVMGASHQFEIACVERMVSRLTMDIGAREILCCVRMHATYTALCDSLSLNAFSATCKILDKWGRGDGHRCAVQCK